MPTRSTLTSTPRPPATSSSDGFGTSRRCTEFFVPGMTATAFIIFVPPHQQRRDQPRPAGLVRCTDPGAVVAVEVFVEKNVITEVRVALQTRIVAVDGAPPMLIAQEDAHEP